MTPATMGSMNHQLKDNKYTKQMALTCDLGPKIHVKMFIIMMMNLRLEKSVLYFTSYLLLLVS